MAEERRACSSVQSARRSYLFASRSISSFGQPVMHLVPEGAKFPRGSVTPHGPLYIQKVLIKKKFLLAAWARVSEVSVDSPKPRARRPSRSFQQHVKPLHLINSAAAETRIAAAACAPRVVQKNIKTRRTA